MYEQLFWGSSIYLSILSNSVIHNQDYKNWTEFICNKIKLAHTNTAFKVNSEMLNLYWEIGNSIIDKQKQNGWGSKVIELLASDLANIFPNNTGFSVRNLKYMRAFAEAYPQFPIVQVPLAQSKNQFMQVPLAQITWYHHISLLIARLNLCEPPRLSEAATFTINTS